MKKLLTFIVSAIMSTTAIAPVVNINQHNSPAGEVHHGDITIIPTSFVLTSNNATIQINGMASVFDALKNIVDNDNVTSWKINHFLETISLKNAELTWENWILTSYEKLHDIINNDTFFAEDFNINIVVNANGEYTIDQFLRYQINGDQTYQEWVDSTSSNVPFFQVWTFYNFDFTLSYEYETI